MTKEIERKFLVNGEFKPYATNSVRIIQGYLSKEVQSSVRIRIMGKKGFLTIKGESDKTGLVRNEWEYEIPVSDARGLLELCSGGYIEKIRYYTEFEGHTYEVDEFMGENKGLCIAELELKKENEAFTKPPWLSDEVTGDPKYFNLMLLKQPFKQW